MNEMGLDVMQDEAQPAWSPTEFIAVANQTLEYAYSSVLITGEVASFKVNQGKWVFFDIKDEESSVSCFMTLWALRQPLEDGMKVVVRGTPKVTKWGKFSFTVNAVRPVGEGSLKKAYEMLKKKLAGEGLFDPAKKRGIPEDLTRLGVISSTGAAGYADFVKIINARWGGMTVYTAHCQVQGMDAADQMIRALKYFNERGGVQMIAMLRGGGSADDLACFNDERLVREVAASRIPVICGIGHEVDESLCDLACDVRASTPSNAAEMLTRDRVTERERVREAMLGVARAVVTEASGCKNAVRGRIDGALEGVVLQGIERRLGEVRASVGGLVDRVMLQRIRAVENETRAQLKILEALNPEKVLRQGYAIVTGKMSPGTVVKITTVDKLAEAEIKTVKERK